jgi:arginase
VRRIVADLDGAVDVVGLTVAEFIPRQVIHLQQILRAFPLISGTTAGPAS